MIKDLILSVKDKTSLSHIQGGKVFRPAQLTRSALLKRQGVVSVYRLMYIWFMSKRYSIAEARSNLPAIVDQAEAGLEIELTRHGKPVAVVVSLRQLERRRGDEVRFSDAYKKFLKRYSLKEVGLDDGFLQSVRDKGVGREVSF